MTRHLGSGVLLLAFAACLPAQIVGLELHADALTKYPLFVREREGKAMVIGELVSGLKVESPTGPVMVPANAKKIVLWVPDPDKPDLPIYETDGKGNRKLLAKNREVSIAAEDVVAAGARIVFPHQSLPGFRADYLRKRAELDRLHEEQKKHRAGTAEWFEVQRGVLAELGTLAGWLRSTVFTAAAARLEKEYGAELKKAGEAASKSRFERARRSLKPVEIPARLTTMSKEFGGGNLKWHGRQTQHLRIIATDERPTTLLEGSALLGERIIEAFRKDYVDPYVVAGEPDPIPEGVFHEWFLAPEDETLGARFLEEYWGQKLPEPRDRAIKIPGHRRRKAGDVDYLHFFRFQASTDLEGLVAHSLGHALPNIAWNQSHDYGLPDWIGEGFGYWVSFEHLSRNSDSCILFAPRDYVRSGGVKEGTKPTVEQGLRATFIDLALRQGPPLGRLMQLTLVEMEAGDVAKGWSLIEWMTRENRDAMGPFIRACCAFADNRGKVDIQKLRPEAARIFKTPEGKDPLAAIDDAWKDYATKRQ